MGAQLNIEGEDTDRLASRQSELTGVVNRAPRVELVREEPARAESGRDRDERLRRIRAITADIRGHLCDPRPSSDHDWLYDKSRLPK